MARRVGSRVGKPRKTLHSALLGSEAASDIALSRWNTNTKVRVIAPGLQGWS